MANRHRKTRPKEKGEINFRTPKKAFDETIDAYVKSMTTTIQAIPLAGGKGTRNPAAPDARDFRIDVDDVVHDIIKNRIHLMCFYERYVEGNIPDPPAEGESVKPEELRLQHLYSRYEQQIGRLLIKRGIWATNGHVGAYFKSIRKERND